MHEEGVMKKVSRAAGSSWQAGEHLCAKINDECIAVAFPRKALQQQDGQMCINP